MYIFFLSKNIKLQTMNTWSHLLEDVPMFLYTQSWIVIFSTNSRLRCAGRARGGRCAALQVEEPMGSPQARMVSNAERQSLCAKGGEATGRSWTRLTGLPPSRKPLTITPRTLLTLTTVNMFCQKQFKISTSSYRGVLDRLQIATALLWRALPELGP